MIDVQAITRLHREMVLRWHAQDIDNPFDGLLGMVCAQFSFNFQLWHQEDLARSPDVDDRQMADIKRNIDRFNQLRNDLIEKLDDWLAVELAARGTTPAPGARLNTETPGSVIDRLSILALRLYHLEEQLERLDATQEHLGSVERKLAIARQQQADLSGALVELVDDLEAGRKRHATYRQMKMYNDPELNPHLYQARRRVA